MKVLAINGSGRKHGYSAGVLKDIIKDLHHESDLVHLVDYNISGCIGCLKCARTNICVQKDGFHDLIDQMLSAEIVVFSGPNYYGSLNGISSSFWERTFALRHLERFALAGKMAIAISMDRPDHAPALKHIVKMMESNKMAILSKFTNVGHYQCYDCGVGHQCVVGNVFPRQGLCSPEYAQANRPKEYKDNSQAKKEVFALSKLINSILDARQSK